MDLQKLVEDHVWSINELELDKQLNEPPKKFIGSGEDVCLEELLDD